MTSSEEFAENRSFILPNNGVGVDAKALKKFVDEYGPEIAKGYLMAIMDMQDRVRDVYCTYIDNHWTGEDFFSVNSPKVSKKNARDLLLHIGNVLQIGSAVTGYPEQSYLNDVKMPPLNPKS